MNTDSGQKPGFCSSPFYIWVDLAKITASVSLSIFIWKMGLML